jgi:hypothetical protein
MNGGDLMGPHCDEVRASSPVIFVVGGVAVKLTAFLKWLVVDVGFGWPRAMGGVGTYSRVRSGETVDPKGPCALVIRTLYTALYLA